MSPCNLRCPPCLRGELLPKRWGLQMLDRLTSHALTAVSLIVAPMAAQTSQRATPDTSWVTRSALYEVFVQDFSSKGSFRGVIDGLDRIESSGANVIWLMPVHPIGVVNRKGRLGSPYAALDYRTINPTYGNAA